MFLIKMLKDIITGAGNGHKKQIAPQKVFNWVFHIFTVWGNRKLITHRWAAFFSEAQNMKGLCKVLAALQAFLLLGPDDPADPVELEVSVADRDAKRSLLAGPKQRLPAQVSRMLG